MQKLQCEICGGNLVMDESGEFAACENCGMKFKKETIKKMIVELSGPVQVDGISNVDNLLKRAYGFLEDGYWKQAEEYLEKVLDLQPESAQAYLGILMVGIKCRGVNDLALARVPIDSNPNFQKALRCADEGYRATLLGYAGASRENFRAQLKNIVKGGNLLFGAFQSAGIVWRVLEVNDARALLLSEKCLAAEMPFDKERITNQWKDCSLRRWLNGALYDKAFSEEDKAMISMYNVSEAPAAVPQVLDKLFLLSIDELNRYFADIAARKAVNLNSFTACWWLRTPGSYQYNACSVYNDGGVNIYGSYVSGTGVGVRPALWINLPS